MPYEFLLCKRQEKGDKLNTSTSNKHLSWSWDLHWIYICIIVHALDNIAICINFSLIVKLPMHLNPPTTWSSRFWYPNLVGSFMISQQVFWYPNATMTITRWANHLYSASVNFGSQVCYIIIDNLMNESLSFRTILTNVTFVMASVAYLMLDPTFFVLRMSLGTFILPHVLVKCHLEAFVALPWSSEIFLPKPDTPVCQTGQSSFDRLALKLHLLDR
jgi:hypothetical protein